MLLLIVGLLVLVVSFKLYFDKIELFFGLFFFNINEGNAELIEFIIIKLIKNYININLLYLEKENNKTIKPYKYL